MNDQHPADMQSVLQQNIQALVDHRRQQEEHQGVQVRIAGIISRFAGSMPFVYLHLAILIAWILANLGLIPAVPAWDPTFVILAMVASVEAIFLSTFVLINQNRMAEHSERRAELDLQISLLNEHETTRLIEMVAALTERLNVSTPADQELPQLAENVDPRQVMTEIQQASGDQEKS
ncbi:DUF1003 domain-containing protein [Mesorhizobium sp. B2-5-9]|nr:MULTISPECIES: DUF1003 domain-containing protein [Mesorhizobium]MBZ9726082.1 DUF1003 domain-containing protein [Mesorhizobium sp. CO1-1-11]MBZ9907979.1 DUF1003 domain-containing protein [Mesorhizobium sp. BR115XR7A]MBZ9933338.1 DUF1003 domain-containing protein [Mesorhizobium sp. BR1-1-5]TPJ14502.1 DUF1003 domain-containing protein [Mesorhizobium sp. B2-7-3]TPK18811.1 DUF1003 domain-containing protein [Mesorhizobium sp. B2-5-9]